MDVERSRRDDLDRVEVQHIAAVHAIRSFRWNPAAKKIAEIHWLSLALALRTNRLPGKSCSKLGGAVERTLPARKNGRKTLRSRLRYLLQRSFPVHGLKQPPVRLPFLG